jgi:hypothetical protein
VSADEYISFIEVIKNSNPQKNPNHLDHVDSTGDIKRKMSAFPNAMEYWKNHKGLSFGDRPKRNT